MNLESMTLVELNATVKNLYSAIDTNIRERIPESISSEEWMEYYDQQAKSFGLKGVDVFFGS